MSTVEVRCRCGELLSANGQTWGPKQGYRVSRRSIDGTPIRGTIGRPDTKGAKPLCRTCVDAAVSDLRYRVANRVERP